MSFLKRTIPLTQYFSVMFFLVLGAGCAEEPVEIFEETPVANQYHFPVMLNERVLRADGHSVILRQDAISDVVVGELTENTDESFTAVVSFVAGDDGEPRYQCEARVTYHVDRVGIADSAGEILIHSVEELETLSLALAD